MYEAQVTVRNVPGIHARPAAQLVQKASLYKSEVFFATPELTVNGKSIMGVMMLAASRGTTLTISADGPDEDSAMQQIEGLILDRFQESE